MAISDRIVVMDRGAVVQHGTAEALYRHPESAFVAQFIGRSNLIAARIRALQPDGVEIEIAGVAHRLDGPPPPVGLGAAVRLVVRPETVGLGPPGEPGTVPATVTTRVYLGDKTEYELAMGDAVIQAVIHAATGGPPVGAAVGVRLPRADVAILPND